MIPLAAKDLHNNECCAPGPRAQLQLQLSLAEAQLAHLLTCSLTARSIAALLQTSAASTKTSTRGACCCSCWRCMTQGNVKHRHTSRHDWQDWAPCLLVTAINAQQACACVVPAYTAVQYSRLGSKSLTQPAANAAVAVMHTQERECSMAGFCACMAHVKQLPAWPQLLRTCLISASASRSRICNQPEAQLFMMM